MPKCLPNSSSLGAHQRLGSKHSQTCTCQTTYNFFTMPTNMAPFYLIAKWPGRLDGMMHKYTKYTYNTLFKMLLLFLQQQIITAIRFMCSIILTRTSTLVLWEFISSCEIDFYFVSMAKKSKLRPKAVS